MSGLRIGSLFSGAGGLDLAVEAMFGARTVWHCENDAAASRVLARRWPGVANFGDIMRVDWSAVEPVDIVCAGWPCQPFSVAGRRKGVADERALWPYVAGAVRMVRPRIVVLENVSAVLGPEFSRAANDLAAFGYDLRWKCLRASDVGAPHRRERVFIIAYAEGDRRHEGRPEPARLVRGSDVALSSAGPVDLLPTPRSSDCFGAGRHGDGGMDLRTTVIENASQWGKYDASIRRWELLTRPAPAPTEPNTKGNPRLAAAFSEWLMGWPDGWVTQVPGVSRNDALRIIGNGVCIQQAMAALQLLLSIEEAV